MTRNQAVVRAFGGKVQLGALCAAAGGAAVFESWLLLVLGMATFVGLVVRDVRAREVEKRPRAPRMPQGSTFANPSIRGAIDGIGAAQRERVDVLRTCPEDILRMLGDVLRASGDAEAAALRLARRTDRLHGYLASKDMASVKETLYAAQQSARLAKTPREREIYEAAARAYETEVETMSAIDLGVRVAVAKLENIRAALAVVPPRIVKLSATSAELSDLAFPRLSDELRTASEELEDAEARFLVLARGAEREANLEYGRAVPAQGAVRIAVMKADPSEELLELDGLAQSEHACARHAIVPNAALGR